MAGFPFFPKKKKKLVQGSLLAFVFFSFPLLKIHFSSKQQQNTPFH
jgi:hypothetical protein